MYHCICAYIYIYIYFFFPPGPLLLCAAANAGVREFAGGSQRA